MRDLTEAEARQATVVYQLAGGMYNIRNHLGYWTEWLYLSDRQGYTSSDAMKLTIAWLREMLAPKTET